MTKTFNKFYLKGSKRWGIRISGEESRLVLGTMNKVNELAAELELLGYNDSKDTTAIAEMLRKYYPKVVKFK